MCHPRTGSQVTSILMIAPPGPGAPPYPSLESSPGLQEGFGPQPELRARPDRESKESNVEGHVGGPVVLRSRLDHQEDFLEVPPGFLTPTGETEDRSAVDQDLQALPAVIAD